MESTDINSSIIIANSKHGGLMEPWGYSLAAALLLLIGFLGFVLNALVIYLMCRNIKLWTPMNIILFNLVCSDLSVSVIGNPLTLTAAISHGWIFGKTMCIAYGFFMALLGITSITTLTVLAYERCSLITYPLSSHPLTIRGALVAVFFIWVYSLVLTTPPLFGWGTYGVEAANISCSVNWEVQTVNATSYVIFLFNFGLVIPVFVIIYSYLRIAYTVRKNSERLGRKSRAERRVAVMIAVMIIAFLVAWTPYAVCALVAQFAPADTISPGMGIMPALLAKSSICYNPLIYVGLNTQFRSTLKDSKKADSTIVEATEQQDTISQSSMNVDCNIKSIRASRTLLRLKPKSVSTPQDDATTYENRCVVDNATDPEVLKPLKDDEKDKTYLDSNSNQQHIRNEKELIALADGQALLKDNDPDYDDEDENTIC